VLAVRRLISAMKADAATDVDIEAEHIDYFKLIEWNVRWKTRASYKFVAFVAFV